MILGSPCTGKSTNIKVLSAVMNQMNNRKLRKEKSKLIIENEVVNAEDDILMQHTLQFVLNPCAISS